MAEIVDAASAAQNKALVITTSIKYKSNKPEGQYIQNWRQIKEDEALQESSRMVPQRLPENIPR